MKSSLLVVGSLLALGATGCLATKGDIQLLQNELRATRATVARSDSAHRRTSDSLAAALSTLASMQARADQALQQSQLRAADDLKALSARAGAFELATKEQLKSLSDDVDQVREISRQNSRGAALARAQAEQAVKPPVALPPDSTTSAKPPAPSGPPGPATLIVAGRSQIYQGSCATARRSFEEVLRLYPDSQEAAEAQYSVAESFVACGEGGNPARADSVYTLVTAKYPTSDFAATSLYKRAEMQRNAGKRDVAQPLYQRVVCEYPKSTVYAQALSKLGSRPVCK